MKKIRKARDGYNVGGMQGLDIPIVKGAFEIMDGVDVHDRTISRVWNSTFRRYTPSISHHIGAVRYDVHHTNWRHHG